MTEAVYAQLAVENTVYHFDKLFSYEVPPELIGKLMPGMRVKIPFGAGNRPRVGLVFSLTSEKPAAAKPISELLDSAAVVSGELLELASWMKEYYYCTYFEAARLMIPSGMNYKLTSSYLLPESFKNFDRGCYTELQWQIVMLLHSSVRAVSFKQISEKLEISEDDPEFLSLLENGTVTKVNMAAAKIRDAVSKMVRPISDYSGNLTKRQKEVYDALADMGSLSEKELKYYTGASSAIIKNLCEKGAAEIFEIEVYRRPDYVGKKEKSPKEHILSDAQNSVFEKLRDQWAEGKGGTALLYGVTGSGKTSVYMRLIEEVHRAGKGIIVMVPEISLTAQTLDAFVEVFGDDVAVFHSGLTLGERLDEWKRVQRGEARIVVGTRSAVFAPVHNLGLIVIDEEQEHTYKSEASPRYDAREVARWRCTKSKAVCLLSSATPSIESAYGAQRKKYSFCKLETRFGKAALPEVELVDLNEDSGDNGQILIGRQLREALSENFEVGHQSIILLNRRGYHTFVSCRECREVVTCPSCSISLTYHSANNRLMCHYCGYSVPFSPICPSCKSESVTTWGVGTQRIEEELSRILPQARILRMDTDSVSARCTVESRLEAFSKGEYDVMVGTQMVAKGLNFENATLVGVVSADQMLYSDDFRSNERAFDLLTQVVGRAGRGKYPGRAMIQTYIPGNPYLHLAAKQDYFNFYRREIVFRKAMLYPPFADILVMGFVGDREQRVQKAAVKFTEELKRMAGEEYPDIPLRILKAAPAAVAKVSDKYRYRMLIKCRNSKRLREMIHRLLVDYAKDRENQYVTVYADNNPVTII